jgi:hypothetical protein
MSYNICRIYCRVPLVRGLTRTHPSTPLRVKRSSCRAKTRHHAELRRDIMPPLKVSRQLPYSSDLKVLLRRAKIQRRKKFRRDFSIAPAFHRELPAMRKFVRQPFFCRRDFQLQSCNGSNPFQSFCLVSTLKVKVLRSVLAGQPALPATSVSDIEPYGLKHTVPSFQCSTARYGL